MAYTIRPARPSEFAQLPAIERAAGALFKTVDWLHLPHDEPMGREFIEAAARAGAVLVAAGDDDVPIGFALAGFLDDALHLYEIDVVPAHGRRGIGRRLLDAVCGLATERGATVVTLATFRDIPWNAPFYASAGFREVPRNRWTPALHLLHHREMDIGLPVDRRCFMRKELA